MYTCGITGSSGILGSAILKKINFKFIKFMGDISKKNHVEKWIMINDFDYLIHLAAIVPTDKVQNNYKYAKKVNFHGTRYLVDAIIKYKKKPKLFFFASTSHVYKPRTIYSKIKENSPKIPYSKYGKTKLMAENYFKKKLSKKKINYCIGRIFSFTNIKQEKSFIVPGLFNKIKNSKKDYVCIENLNHYRDFIGIEDICKAIEILCKKRIIGIYNIGTGKKIKMAAIATYFTKKLKKKIVVKKSLEKKTFLISNNNKILKIGWKPKKNFFRELNQFK